VKVMRKLLLLLAGAAVLCLPAVSVAGTSAPTAAKLAAQACRSIRAHDGQKLFRQTYHSFAGCLNKDKPQAAQDISNAAKTCKALKKSDPATFQATYGTNGGNTHGAGANAFGKCVSTIAKQKAKDDAADSVAAAKTCKALKKSDLATFQATYGTGRNAFGMCVSRQSKASG
jgi:streptogramin lyase